MTRLCLFCMEQIKETISWSLFTKQKEDTAICFSCQKALEILTGEACSICSKVLDEYRQENRCLDCHRWERDVEWMGLLKKNTSLFGYNSFLKDLISKFKYRGDYAIVEGFSEYIKKEVEMMPFDLAVPIPLSEERLYERGFNQAEAIGHAGGISLTSVLIRTHSEKQSKKSRQERLALSQVFKVNDLELCKNRKILLIDDIYTTGSTIRHAARELKKAGATEIYSFTLAR